MAINAPLNRRLRMGLIGGGQGAFIGRVHAAAAVLDHRAVLLAGALSSDPVKARASAPDYGIAPERAYGSYREMAAAERGLPEGERVDFVTIATPNHTHYEIARLFAEAGFNVVCDKPMTLDLEQAEELARVVAHTGIVFALMHGYTGYPMVRQARDMVAAGELGEVQAVRVAYLQGSLRRPRTSDQPRRAWKADPVRAGASGCFGDIGIHAYNLLRFTTGLMPGQVSCQLRVFEPGGQLDDYGAALLRFAGGTLGTVTASRISHGRENDLRLDIDGTRGSLEWHQEDPNRLWFRSGGQAQRLYTRDPGAAYISGSARLSCRLPAGHPEGFIEAFANVYLAAYADMTARAGGLPWDGGRSLYPNVQDGVDGMSFVTSCVASSQAEGAWTLLQPFSHPMATPPS